MRLALVLVVAGCYHEPHVGSDDAPPPIDGPRDTSSVTCPAAYSIHGQTARYRFTAAAGTYLQVAADCKSDGGHLAKIVDTVEDAFIDTAFSAASVPTSSYVWIGLSDPNMNDTYQWYDGTALGAYNGFMNGHIPNDNGGQHNCVDKAGGGLWAIYYCDFVELGFCECN